MLVADEFSFTFEFQSLTGRLKTGFSELMEKLISEFQSLTGRLKTNDELKSAPASVRVSIPHR